MGRLMDDVLAMFGVKPSDRVVRIQSFWPFSSPTSAPSDEELIILPPGTEAAPQDCMSCRIIGTTTLTAMGTYCAYVVYNKQSKMKIVGRKRVAYIAAGVSLSASFYWMAICRAFDLGGFRKQEKDETFGDIVKDEVNAVRDFKDQIFKSNQSSSK